MHWKAALQKALQLQLATENSKLQKKEKSRFKFTDTKRCTALQSAPSCKDAFPSLPFRARFPQIFRFYFSSDSANLPQFSSKGIFLLLWRDCKRSQTQESE